MSYPCHRFSCSAPACFETALVSNAKARMTTHWRELDLATPVPIAEMLQAQDYALGNSQHVRDRLNDQVGIHQRNGDENQDDGKIHASHGRQ